MQYDDSQRFATSSVLQFVLYRTRVYSVCPNPPVPHGPAIGNGGAWTVHSGVIGWYPPSSPALPPPVLGGQHIRIVSTDNPQLKHELTRMSEEQVERMVMVVAPAPTTPPPPP